MNKDIKEIMKFKPFHISISHEWSESEDGMTPENAYIAYTSNGKIEGKVTNLQLFNELLARKTSRDMHKKMWTDGLKNSILSVYELIEDDYESLAFDCMKDIIKTTDRFTYLNQIDGLALANRNWFIDKLNIKYPKDMCDCYICKEAYWKTGNYIKQD